MCNHKNHHIKAILITTCTNHTFISSWKTIYYHNFASRSGTISYSQWLELPPSRTHFHGPIGVLFVKSIALDIHLDVYNGVGTPVLFHLQRVCCV